MNSHVLYAAMWSGEHKLDAHKSASSTVVNLLVERWNLDPRDVAFWVQSLDSEIGGMSEGDRIIAKRIKDWYAENISGHGYGLPPAREPTGEGWGRVMALRNDPNDRLVQAIDMILRDVLLQHLGHEIAIPKTGSAIRYPELSLAHIYDRAHAGAHIIARYRIARNNRTVVFRTTVSDGEAISMPEDGRVVLPYYNTCK